MKDDISDTRRSTSIYQALTIEGVSKTFNADTDAPVTALLPIDLTIEPGEFVAVIGPSGCGKSTLLNIVAGFENATIGQVRVGGCVVDTPDIDRGMVFQQYALFPWLSVEQNVGFGLKRQGVSAPERQKIVARYLDMVGLNEFAKADPASLSGGMKQRVALARTFCTDPSIILMDEPFGALDALTRNLLQRELLNIWQRDSKTVMLVTHSVQEALYLASRIVVMTNRPGSIKMDMQLDLPYPRDIHSDAFHKLEASILEELTDELAKGYGGRLNLSQQM